MGFGETPGRQRWPRTQRFTLTERGVQSEDVYRSTIVAARAEPGRASFDLAREAWATSFGIHSDDGLCLCEIREQPLRMDQLVSALESCGKTRQEVRAAVERLVDAGLLEAAPAP